MNEKEKRYYCKSCKKRIAYNDIKLSSEGKHGLTSICIYCLTSNIVVWEKYILDFESKKDILLHAFSKAIDHNNHENIYSYYVQLAKDTILRMEAIK